MTDSLYAEEVAEGIEFLNDEVPDWWTLIDLDTLDLSSADVCVLGQVFAARADETGLASGYHYVLNQYENMHYAVTSMGFCAGTKHNAIYGGTCSDEYDDLNAEWARVITNLRAEVNA